ncbi:MAG TPA: hypothetical protein VJQ47_13925 [Steroidobacteraceae bacterium]|nr:hypothetical protein [Steroidobacteraceae bacterium]
MRKIWTLLALSFVLLLSQQGAVLHEIGHLVRIGSEGLTAHTQPDSLAEKTCQLCPAFSQLTHPAGSSPVVTFDELAGVAVSSDCLRSSTPADAPTARSRGPPAKLNS